MLSKIPTIFISFLHLDHLSASLIFLTASSSTLYRLFNFSPDSIAWKINTPQPLYNMKAKIQSRHMLDEPSCILRKMYCTVNPRYNKQHLFPKMLPLKWICFCKEFFMDRMICKKNLVLFFLTHRTCFGYLLELPQRGNSNKYPKHMLLEVLIQYSCIISH